MQPEDRKEAARHILKIMGDGSPLARQLAESVLDEPDGVVNLGRCEVSVDLNLAAKWVRWECVDDGCYWWWWNEDEDSAPVPVFVMYSGTSGIYFASAGQLGWERAQDVKEMGGWWMKVVEPALPNADR